MRPSNRYFVAALAAVALVLALSACGSSSSAATSASTSAGATAHVTIKNFHYTSDHLQVAAGTKVVFTNEDNQAHTATADMGAFNTGPIAPGTSKTVSLPRPGTFAYHCSFHPFMTGTIVVR